MNAERQSWKMLECYPLGTSRKGRYRNSWMQDVTTAVRENEINRTEWIDREEGRRKIKL